MEGKTLSKQQLKLSTPSAKRILKLKRKINRQQNELSQVKKIKRHTSTTYNKSIALQRDIAQVTSGIAHPVTSKKEHLLPHAIAFDRESRKDEIYSHIWFAPSQNYAEQKFAWNHKKSHPHNWEDVSYKTRGAIYIDADAEYRTYGTIKDLYGEKIRKGHDIGSSGHGSGSTRHNWGKRAKNELKKAIELELDREEKLASIGERWDGFHNE